MTLNDAISIALKSNYDILLEEKSLEIASNNNSIGNAGWLPSIELNGATNTSIRNTEQELNFGEGPVTQSRDGAESSTVNVGAQMSWTLFDGLKMFATKDRLNQIQQSNELALKAQIQTTVSDVSKAYYNAALEQERMALLESSLQLSQERVQISKDKYELGKASKLEYLQAQVDYNSDKSALVKQQESIARAKMNLWRIIGDENLSSSILLVYNDSLNEIIDYDILEEKSLNSNPQLQSLITDQAVSLLTIKERKREYYPSLDFNMGYTYSEQNNEVGVLIRNQATGLNYGLTASMTIFNGFNQSREIQNARINAESAELEYKKARTQLLTSLKTAYLTYQNAVELTKLEGQNLAVAEENVSIALERYRIGKSNPLEIREAQNNAVNAQIRHLEALNTAKIAEIELLRLTGEIVK